MVDKHNQEVLKWLDDNINKLKSFKSYVENGSVIVVDGYFDDSFPSPQKDERVENNISLSIDYIEAPRVKKF